MSLQPVKEKRRMLPRWRALSQAAGVNADFQPVAVPKLPKVSLAPQLSLSVEHFVRDQNLGTAAELLSTALLSDARDQAFSAAKFILANQDVAPLSLIEMASTITADSCSTQAPHRDAGRQTAHTRQLLRLEPRNPMLWSDMARHFATIGDRDRAKGCMTTALSLAPDHRWILRTAARFFAHSDDRVTAHRLIANHPRTRTDPWLIAAELACAQAAGRPPKYWKQATEILRANRIAPQHTSELATAVAMMELECGETKKAKRFVHQGLIVPTENVLAQVYWATEHRNLKDGFNLPELLRTATNAYEADYIAKIVDGDLLGALTAARVWSEDEPFAARPCSAIAYVASMLDDHETTIQMANRVRRLDRKADPSLELNAIFATLSSGRYSPSANGIEIDRIGRVLLKTADSGSEHAYHAAANFGLLLYRSGHPDLARNAYQQAIALAQKQHKSDAAAMAAIFAAREAILASDICAHESLITAQELTVRAKFKMADFYLRKVEALFATPSAAAEILSPSSAERFLAESRAKAPPKPFRVERTKEGDAIIWLGTTPQDGNKKANKKGLLR